jgi:hypothetical protein
VANLAEKQLFYRWRHIGYGPGELFAKPAILVESTQKSGIPAHPDCLLNDSTFLWEVLAALKVFPRLTAENRFYFRLRHAAFNSLRSRKCEV